MSEPEEEIDETDWLMICPDCGGDYFPGIFRKRRCSICEAEKDES